MPSFKQNFGLQYLKLQMNCTNHIMHANVWIKHKQCVVGILTLHLDSFANDFEQLGHNITAGSNARI